MNFVIQRHVKFVDDVYGLDGADINYFQTVGQYLSLSSFPSCFSPRNSTASMMAFQVGGGWTCSNHTPSISIRQFWGSSRHFSAMPDSVPLAISKRTPITFHLSATLWQSASIRSFSIGFPSDERSQLMLPRLNLNDEMIAKYCIVFYVSAVLKMLSLNRYKSNSQKDLLTGIF